MEYFYKKVWAPDGTMFEVTHERASQLVLNKGWSNTPPKTAKPSKKGGRKAAKVSVEIETVDVVEEESTEQTDTSFATDG